MRGVFPSRNMKFGQLGFSFSSRFHNRSDSRKCRKESISFKGGEAPNLHFPLNEPQRPYSGWSWLSRRSTPGCNVLIGISRDNISTNYSNSIRLSKDTDRESWTIRPTLIPITSSSTITTVVSGASFQDISSDITSETVTQNRMQDINSYIDNNSQGRPGLYASSEIQNQTHSEPPQQKKGSNFMSTVIGKFKFTTSGASTAISPEKKVVPTEQRPVCGISFPASLSSIAKSPTNQTIPLIPPPAYCVEHPSLNPQSGKESNLTDQVPQELVERYKPAQKPQVQTTTAQTGP